MRRKMKNLQLTEELEKTRGLMETLNVQIQKQSQGVYTKLVPPYPLVPLVSLGTPGCPPV